MYRTVALLSVLALSCGRGPEGTAAGDCEDLADNDGDGLIDCLDQGCARDPFCEAAKEKAARAQAAAAKAEESEARRLEELASRPYLEIGGLWVQKGHNGADVDFAEAGAYCDGLSLADRDDWRLPTTEEAVAISRSGRLAPEPYVMWTSDKKGRKRAAIVGITSAAVNDLGVQYDGDCRARCVRAP